MRLAKGQTLSGVEDASDGRAGRYVDHCPNCGSTSFTTWAATVAPSRIHMTQCRCSSCGLVFSNPVSDPTAVEEYYERRYYEEQWPYFLSHAEQDVCDLVELKRAEVPRIRGFVATGSVLDVGCGCGFFLAGMRDAGFDTFGVELSQSGVAHCRTVLGLDNIALGAFEETSYPSESFDVVHAWHVIEHVFDLDRFLHEIHRILRPGGLLWLGTENYHNAAYMTHRLYRGLQGKPPAFATATEHTFAFTARTLGDVVRRRGFEVVRTESYHPPLGEVIGSGASLPRRRRGYYLLRYVADRVLRTGPLMRLVAVRE